MVTVEEASRIIFSHRPPRKTVEVPIEDAVGRILAETVVADRPFPPFDRVAMDGIAIAFEAYSNGQRSFSVEGTQAAGSPRTILRNANNCIEVMTGAVLPGGTDTVIRYEDLEQRNGSADVKATVTKGQNIHVRGVDADEGAVLLEPGIAICPAEVALLATVGRRTVVVSAFPRTALISTGDELVDISEKPAEHQIRKSNTYALAAAMNNIGWKAELLHLIDREEMIKEFIGQVLNEFDVLIFSGGVSRGKFDFIPQVLEGLGVRKHFHGVAQRPGKPLWFGTSPEGKTVFALPGNPVSTFMCFYRYIQPWIKIVQGAGADFPKAVLNSDFRFEPPVTLFLQVNVHRADSVLRAEPFAGGGSGDFANLKNVSGFLELPANQSSFNRGDIFPFIPFRA